MVADECNSRGDFFAISNDLKSKSCQIAFLGNSITAQKEGFTLFLKEKLDSISGFKHSYINAGLGGVGSLASCFIVDDFVIRHKPDICFVECTVADIGSATPISYIESSISGIIEKLVYAGVKICLLHLYSSHTSLTQIKEVINLYDRVSTYYNIPSINLNQKISNGINSGDLRGEEVVYDGVHTTEQGAILYADEICQVIFGNRGEGSNFSGVISEDCNLNQKPFVFTQLVIPPQLSVDPSNEITKCRYRGLIKYIKVNPAFRITYSQDLGKIVGFLIIADDESGVLLVEHNSQKRLIQTSDIWCHKERIQAVILEKPICENETLTISLTFEENGTQGANGTINLTNKIGCSFKLIGLMLVLNEESLLKSPLW